MTDESTCPTLRDEDDEVAKEYLAGSLSPQAAAAFEEHLRTCHRCQRAVEQAAGITAALRTAATGRDVRRPSALQRWAIPVAIAVAAAAWFAMRS